MAARVDEIDAHVRDARLVRRAEHGGGGAVRYDRDAVERLRVAEPRQR